MSKTKKIIYWIATVWLALGMVSTGIVQIMQMKEEMSYMLNLGYPMYFLTIIGVWKLLGSVAILLPKIPVVKEWAYAGFFFTTTGALASHFAAGSPTKDFIPALLLLVLTIVSWYLRPASKKTVVVNQ